MSNGDMDRLRLLSHAAREQRTRLRARMNAARVRLAPDRLKNDARITAEAKITEAARGVTDGVKRHPLAAGLAVAGALAWAFRDPLMAHGPGWLKDAYDRLAGHLPFSVDDANESRAELETSTEDVDYPTNDNDRTGVTVPQYEDTLPHD